METVVSSEMLVTIRLYGVTSQETVTVLVTDVETSNLVYKVNQSVINVRYLLNRRSWHTGKALDS